MKRAIGYVRVSTADQSNYSPDGQEEMIRNHCRKNSIELLDVFRDEGYTAWNFDRPDWIRLQEFVKKYHSKIDELIVIKFDRFSRRAHQALQMLEQMEENFGILVSSVQEPIGLHSKSPYYFKIRADIITGAQVELMMIRDRTRFGMVSGASKGRYLNRAPFGYINARDNENKPILVIDEIKADLVREIYNRFLSGETINAIRQRMKEKGVLLRGNSAYQTLLQNPAYMGYVIKPAYYDEPEAMVKGLHTGIIAEDTWYKVHAIFNQKKPLQRVTLNNDLPMKGVLNCFCGRPVTAGNSKGRNQYFWYYKCNTHTKFNLSANKLHKQFNEILQHLSFPAFHIEYLQKKIIETITDRMKQQVTLAASKEKDLSALLIKCDQLEEKYITSEIDRDTYTKWKARYVLERSTLQAQLADFRQPVSAVWEKHTANLKRLADLQFLYNHGTVEKKQSFVKLVFNNRLYYQDGCYRTPFLLPVFAHKALELKEKGLLVVEQPEQEISIFGECTPGRS